MTIKNLLHVHCLFMRNLATLMTSRDKRSSMSVASALVVSALLDERARKKKPQRHATVRDPPTSSSCSIHGDASADPGQFSVLQNSPQYQINHFPHLGPQCIDKIFLNQSNHDTDGDWQKCHMYKPNDTQIDDFQNKKILFGKQTILILSCQVSFDRGVSVLKIAPIAMLLLCLP